MKKNLRFLKLWVLFLAVSFAGLNAQVSVTADHSKWVDFPLMKIYGVNIPNEISYSTLETNASLIQDLDVRYVRVKNNWGLEKTGDLFETPQVTISGEDVSIDFTRIDQVVNLIKQNDAQVLFMNGYTPADMDADWKATPDTVDGGEWYKLNKQFAQHWADMKLPGVRYEIWNGTDSSGFYAGDQTGYQVMVREAINGIEDATSDAIVGGGAFFSGKASSFKDKLAEMGSMKLGNDLRVCNFMRFWTAQTVGLAQLQDLVQRGDGEYGSFRRWTDWFDFMHWEVYFTGYSPFELDGADAVNYKAASEFYESTLYLVRYPDVGRVYLDQFIDGTDGKKGLVASDGTKSPLYSALKLYNEMPYDRKELTSGDPDIHGMTSSDDKNAYIVLWNVGDASEDVDVTLSNLPFSEGTVELFRIDDSNDGSTGTDLDDLTGNSLTWDGSIPSKGSVIIKISTGVSSMEDKNFGKYVKDHHFYWFETARSDHPWLYHTFDPKTMVAFIADTATTPGVGDGVYWNWGVSSFGVWLDSIPEKFRINITSQGYMSWMDLNTQLVVRVNYQDTLEGDVLYAKSFVLYDNTNFVFDPAHESNFCYEICAREDDQIEEDFKAAGGIEVDLTELASPYWAGNVVLIIGLQNPGLGNYYLENPGVDRESLMLKFEFEAISTTSINERRGVSQDYDIQVYPVPTSDMLNVRLSENISAPFNVSIMDITGRQVINRQYRDSQEVINVNTAGLPPGIYLINVQHKAGTISRRIIKSR